MSLKYGPVTLAEEFCQKRVPCPYQKYLGKTVSVSLFSKSPISSPYLKQDLMRRNSVASLDGPLISAGPFGDVVEMLWLFRLSKISLLVHKKQNGNW